MPCPACRSPSRHAAINDRTLRDSHRIPPIVSLRTGSSCRTVWKQSNHKVGDNPKTQFPGHSPEMIPRFQSSSKPAQFTRAVLPSKVSYLPLVLSQALGLLHKPLPRTRRAPKATWKHEVSSIGSLLNLHAPAHGSAIAVCRVYLSSSSSSSSGCPT